MICAAVGVATALLAIQSWGVPLTELSSLLCSCIVIIMMAWCSLCLHAGVRLRAYICHWLEAPAKTADFCVNNCIAKGAYVACRSNTLLAHVRTCVN